MIKVCDDKYSSTEYEDLFKTFPFELDSFQKYAIQGVEENKHVLVTAGTGISFDIYY